MEDDAPGWKIDNLSNQQQEDQLGPECWKCRGACQVSVKDKSLPKDQRVVKIECKVCSGKGRLPKKRKEMNSEKEPGKVSKRKRKVPEDWIVPGPEAIGGVEPENGEEICHLLGHWRIFQRIGGHRWSSDDLVTAWVAGRAWRNLFGEEKQPKNCLDLGCGIGSVLMMVAWQFPQAKCLGVEAQMKSFDMAKRSLKYNGCEDRVAVENGDIRKFQGFQTHSEDGKFDLVTGTPPYFPVTHSKETGSASTTYGGLPSCKQSAPARYEFRGGIEAYCEAAKPRLRSTQSRFVVVEGMLDTNHQRVLDAAKNAQLHVVSQVSVHGREDKPALFAVYEMCLIHEKQPEFKHEKLVIRLKGGKRTEEYIELMKTMGIPPPVENE